MSTFWLGKGSSDNLGTFDNEYSYRINLDSLGGGVNQSAVIIN
jgi:hypothetical protein